MYTKLLRLFDDIQKELDTSFAIFGEMYGRNRNYFKLRYRRIKSNLKNRKVIEKFSYVPDTYKFEADTDLFKLLVGPLYGYDSTYGVREMLQNAVDACIELQHKLGGTYEPVSKKEIQLNGGNQKFNNAITVDHKIFDDIIWTYELDKGIAINGITIPDINYEVRSNQEVEKLALDKYPFVSVIDRNNQIDLELNRNAIRGELPFLNELITSCQLDFLCNFLFLQPPVVDNIVNLNRLLYPWDDYGYRLHLKDRQYGVSTIYLTTEGYFLKNIFYNPIIKDLNYYKIYINEYSRDELLLLPGAICELYTGPSIKTERSFIRGFGRDYIAVAAPRIYFDHCESNTIAKRHRDKLQILEQSKDYLFFQTVT